MRFLIIACIPCQKKKTLAYGLKTDSFVTQKKDFTDRNWFILKKDNIIIFF